MTVANSQARLLHVKRMSKGSVIGQAAEGMLERVVCCLSTIVGLKESEPEFG